jgi:hypothetical protein
MTDPQWYTNKELFEMVQRLQTEIGQLRMEIQRTTTLLRDYNGLRERLDECEKGLDQLSGERLGSKNFWGYLVGAVGITTAIISLVIR